MRAFAAAALITFCTLYPYACAAVTVSDQSEALPGVAQETTALLMDAGIKPKRLTDGQYLLEAKNIFCDVHSNAPYGAENPISNLESVKCRINAEDKPNTKKGSPLPDSRALVDLLSQVATKSDDATLFGDCAAGGHCTLFTHITCTIHTTVKDVFKDGYWKGGRWECAYANDEH